MEYKLSDLVKEVRVVMDKNMTSTALSGLDDVDTLSVDDIIKASIPRGARIVETSAPFHLLGRGEPFSGTIYWPKSVGIGSGHIHLPDDFLRLVCFQMSDWVRPASEAITQDSPLYAMQSSEYAGIRGNPHNPVVAIVPWSTGLELEFYSCTVGSDVYVRRARYLPIPTITGDGDSATVNISEKLKDAIVYYSGGLAASSMGLVDLSSALITHSGSLAER